MRQPQFFLFILVALAVLSIVDGAANKRGYDHLRGPQELDNAPVEYEQRHRSLKGGKKMKKAQKGKKGEKLKKEKKKFKGKKGTPNKLSNMVAAESLVAEMGTYPGFDGTLSPTGQVTLRFNDDGSYLVKVNMGGLEPDCAGCGVHVHVGGSCSMADAVGGHYWNGMVFESDPWNDVGFYDTDSEGNTMNGFVIDIGASMDDHMDRTVVLHAANGTRVACGELVDGPRSGQLIGSLSADMGPYPGYEGDADVEGLVTAHFFGDGSLWMDLDLAGLQPNCEKCGVHIHSGTTCDDMSLVGGHYWDADEIGRAADPWVPSEGAYYTSDEDGEAVRSYYLYSGLSLADNIDHAFVVHGIGGARIGCGVLML